jgi:spermidine synthase
MSERKDRGRPAAAVVTSPPMLPWVLLLFIGSGAAALVYEVVWFQLIQLIIGATAVSLGVLLATFMGGMCAGSLLLPRFVPRDRHPLRIYAQLELGVAACGLLILWGLPALGHLYVTNVGSGFAGIIFRGVLCGICLLPPTVLMGATLPAVSRWVDNSPEGVAWLGFFYGGNIAGAVFGSLVSGFYLLRVYDMATATYVAVAVNVAVAALAFVLATRTATRTSATSNEVRFDRTALSTYVATGLSGMAALGAEVIWTRILALLLGATVYTFSIIAATFLAGLGIGSTIGAWLARTSRRPGLLLAGCQVGVGLGVAWAAALMSRAFPYWPIDPALATGPWFNFQIDLLRSMVAILPAACFWGASFPIAIAAIAPRAQDPARLVGGLYAANTIGAVLGALAFSLFVIPAFGTATAQQLLVWLALAAAIVMLVWPAAADAPLPLPRRAATVLGALIVAAIASSTIIPIPPELIAYGRQIATFRNDARYLYTGEGLNSSIAVSEQEGGVRNFHVSGKVEASTEVHDMRLQRLLGHMSALMNPHPKTVLVVGFGAGVTAGSFLLHPDVERVVICEIEPLIPQRVAPYFAKENYDIVHNPKVQIVYDDARHFILTTHEKFDVITSDPIHPWVKGAASLYTKDYFELVKQHLNPGGVVTQWVPLYQSSEDVIKSEMATFFDVFPWGTIWSNQYANGGGYDVIVLAKPEPLEIDPSALDARLKSHPDVAAALDEVELGGVDGLMATYAGNARDLKPWLADAQINSDQNLRLEYLAGMANNVYDAQIYQNILAYRKFPEDMLKGSPEQKERLRTIMTKPPATQ